MKNLEVEILIGIPASGKSTHAKKFVSENHNYVRVSRDDYRKMLKNAQVCDSKMEDMITSLCNHAILSALGKKMNVIVDNTNLKPKYINQIIDLVIYSADVKFRIFDISKEKAIERDKHRTDVVGKSVIDKMWGDYNSLLGSFDFSIRKKESKIYTRPIKISGLSDAIICDADGTLAHMNGKRSAFDWENVDKDEIDHSVFNVLDVYSKAGVQILILTGRDGAAKEKTIKWLDMHNVPYDLLLIKGVNDNRRDTIVKKEMYEQHIKGKYNILFALDDRNSVVSLWRSIGIKTFQVEDGNF